MTTTYNFTSKKNNSNNNTFFLGNKPNYSKILDDIIIADVINKNKYLFETNTYCDYIDDILLNAKPTKYSDDFSKAVNFLANYKSYKNTYPFKLNTMYTLTDGTPIIFYNDEIQIGSDFYKYMDFSNLSFINKLSNNKKKIIIDIYASSGTTIDINIL